MTRAERRATRLHFTDGWRYFWEAWISSSPWFVGFATAGLVWALVTLGAAGALLLVLQAMRDVP